MFHKTFRYCTALFFALVLILSGSTPAQAAPPTNDDFANATVIGGLPFNAPVDTTEATAEANEPQVCSALISTVWYSFTPTENMAIQINMDGSQGGGTVGIFLSSGPAITDLTLLGCINTGFSSNLQIEAGQTYYLRVEPYPWQPGPLNLNIVQITPPANDAFANAQSFTLPFNLSVDNTNATAEKDEPQACLSAFRSVWYTFTPTQDMAVQLDMAGSSANGAAAIYLAAGPAITDLTTVTCASTFNASTNAFLEAGQTYYFQVDSYFGQPGTLQLNISQITPPANDNFADAQTISSLPFNASEDNTNATPQIGESVSCSSPYRSIWYSFTPAETTVVQVDNVGSSLNSAVSIFLATGPAISDLSLLGCSYSFNGIPVNFQLEAGQTYYFKLDSFGQPDTLHLNIQQVTPPANDAFANAESISSLPFNSSVDNTNASAEFAEPQGCSGSFRTVWYSFTAPANMALQVSSPSGSSVNIFLASGPTISDLTLAATCVAGGNTVNLRAEAGQTYYLRLDSFSGQSTVQLNVQQIVPPTNDDFANADDIGSFPVNLSADNSNGTTEPNEPYGCAGTSRSLWYSFSPTETMAARVWLMSGPSGGGVDVYLSNGPSIADLTSVGCTGSFSALNLRFEAGKTYYFRLDSAAPGGVFQLNIEQIIPPPNDDFANAETIGSLPYNATADNSNATYEVGEPFECNASRRSLWYSFTPSENMQVRVNTGNAFNSQIGVYLASGQSFSDLTFLTCTGTTYSRLQLEAGKTYYLRLDSFGTGGSVQVNLIKMNPPANDNFDNAQPITVPFNTTIDITDAGIEPSEPQSCQFMPNTVWYVFAPAETMQLRADTSGSSIAANVNIYKSIGAGLSGLQFMACSGSNTTPALQFEAGQTYYLQAGPSSFQLGTININLVQPTPPVNDDFANATDITSLPLSATLNNIDATTEVGEPQGCMPMSNTVWYSFSPTTTLKVRADLHGSGINGTINVYRATGNELLDLQFMDCLNGRDSFSFNAVAGETYYLQVGAIGQAGIMQLNLAEAPVIMGRVTDAITGLPLPGDTQPYSYTYLYRSCGEGCLDYVNQQPADSQGRFFFDTIYYGVPLVNGDYVIEVSAQNYQTRRFGAFTFSGSSLDVGDLLLAPFAMIQGRAVDSATGNSLVGVYVTLQSCDNSGCNQYVNSQYTDGNGHFLFNNFYYGSPLAAGTYDLQISASTYETKHVQVTIAESEQRDLGDVPVDPLPSIGSISGRLLDAATGAPVSSAFTPVVELRLCNAYCYPVNTMLLDSQGRFNFATDYAGNHLLVGSYKIFAYAEQYQSVETGAFDVAADENKAVGDIKINSFPVRFTDVVACPSIPVSGGDCVFSVRITNGTGGSLSGKVWSLVGASLRSFGQYTDFQIQNGQDLDLGKNKSKVFKFKFSVPGNPGSNANYICPRLFVGTGSQPYLSTVGYKELFCVTGNAAGFTVTTTQDVTPSPKTNTTTVTATEVEPNDSCQSAQDAGAISEALTMNGMLDSSVSPDIDFFHFTAAPGQLLAVDHEGQATGKGTLDDPFLGFFDSNCNLVALNDDSGNLNSHLEITVPADGVFVLAATTCCDDAFIGGGNGTYQLTVTPMQYLNSIKGVVTDTATGKSLAGNVAPYAYVNLYYCAGFGCSWVNSQNTEMDGSFHFETDQYGNPLRAGDYMITVSADQYYPYQSQLFSVGGVEDHNLGSVPLTSYPVRFSNPQICSIPADGGWCEFSVTISNGLATKFTGKAWSIVAANDIGSFTNFTNFQSDSPQKVSLAVGQSTTVTFRFQIRGGLANGAYICTTAYVGQDPAPYFNTVGQRTLFCFVKGSNGFTLMSEQQTQNTMHQIKDGEVEPPNGRSPKK